jgi:spore coat polysaccharide biosynthesis protein SpsF
LKNELKNRGIFITVRTGSTRLPRKALLDIAGRSSIEYLIQRLKYNSSNAKIILCTTHLEDDFILTEIASENGIHHFQGSIKDKLDRWLNASLLFDIDYIVTADGDDLFCDPSLIDLAFKQFDNTNPDFIKCDGIVCGAFTYGIKIDALKKVCGIKNTNDTEMMWHYFTDTGLFNIEELKGVDSRYYRDDIRMTLDYEEDLKFFKEVIKQCKNSNEFLSLDEIIDICDNNPYIKEINYFRQSEFLKNQESKKDFRIKKFSC